MEAADFFMNSAQKETFDYLLSYCDNLKVAVNEEDNGALVFEGNGQDGPCIGYIELDGKVTWIVGG